MSNSLKYLMGNIKNMSEEKGKLIANITHYFGNINVAVLKLLGKLKKEDKIRVVGGGGKDTDFKQKVKSIEQDHKKLEKTKKWGEV